jgi:5'-3' exonuclease
VIQEVSPQTGVYLAIDGVVPMAKMRQQRLRRFKSVWLKQHSVEENTSAWDTNAITPGTLFMKKLHAGLANMIQQKGKSTWILSTSDEPGEGEHKLLSAWRTGTYHGSFAVYGLDADLIVLSLLGQEQCHLTHPIWLFREEVDKGKITYDAMGEEQFEWFSICALRTWLSTETSSDPQIQRQFILNYTFAMSVLGNDFLPSSLGLKIREDGHTELLQLLRTLTSQGFYLIHSESLAVSMDGLRVLFTSLCSQEPQRIEKYIVKKRMMARSLSAPVPLGDNQWPLSEMAEDVLLHSPSMRKLRSDWPAHYLSHFFPGHRTLSHRNQICESYLYGIQWIWAYYTGQQKDVCFNWYYPHSLPPLWEWLLAYLNKDSLPSFPNKVWIRAEDIRPIEQLTLVLPLESWHLIPPCKEKQFPNLAPQCYPTVFSFESVGKRFFWECEAQIPMPSIKELKAIITLA